MILSNLAATAILYYPDASVIDNIRTYYKRTGKVYIIDNTEIIDEHLKHTLKSIDKSVYLNDGKNLGMAARLNQACAFAIRDGFEYLLTMDQDSSFEEKMITRYLECFDHCSNKANVSMFGINFSNQVPAPDCNFNKARILITSGSIINLSVFKKIGGFNEQLFIDFVDTEYCFKSIQNGYDIIQFTNISMQHMIGELSSQRSLKTLQTSKRSFHSSARLYYMTRNYLYLHAKYKNQFKKQLADYRRDLLHRIKNNLLYKHGRSQTIRLLLKAWIDFRNNKMGKLN